MEIDREIRLVDGDWWMEIGGRRLVDGDWWTEIGGQRLVDGGNVNRYKNIHIITSVSIDIPSLNHLLD